MSRYYARGSQYASEIFGEVSSSTGHFCLEWQATQVESATLSYANHVLFTDEKLFGGHAAFVLHRLGKEKGVISSATRTETATMFKAGQLHYRETILGGCTRADEQCEVVALDWLNLNCIATNCSNMVGNLSKLELVIEEQQRLVCSLPPTSLLYRTEKANLQVLLLARDRAQDERNANLK
jgi:hypothetical protein